MKNRIRKIGMIAAVTVAPLGAAAAGVSAADTEARVNELLGRMTLREKVGQLNQLNSAPFDTLSHAILTDGVGSIINETDVATVNRLQRIAVEQTRLGIPLIFGRDVIHGFHTLFPIPLGQASTWNPQLVEEAARVAAVEATARGVRWTFSPMIDIARDARWGRMAESAGEDPVLASRMGVAMVRGYQNGNLADKSSMAACAKHFAGYGFAEAGKDYNTTWIPDQLLEDVVLPPFEAAAKAGAATFMTSFNDINGTPSTANRKLLRDILRERWGFDGVVVSDWDAIYEVITHGVAANKDEATLLAAEAGVDIDMEGHCYIDRMEKLVESGKLSEATVDNLVRNVLRLKFRLGLFDNPYVEERSEYPSYAPAHLAKAAQVAEESVILLKNDGSTLPLGPAVRKIAVIGPMADAPHDQCGTWSLDLQKEHTVTPLAALREMYGDENIIYAPGLEYSRDKRTGRFAEAVEAARKADAVVCFIGEEAVMSGEGHCMADLDLKGAQSALVEALDATGKPLTLVFMAGRPLTVGREIAMADAALYSFHPGTMGGPAIANILSGRANPSGKLPVTMAKMAGQYPMYYASKNTGRPPLVTSQLDSIPLEAVQSSTGCTSYYLDAGTEPLYPFGYGLSYTTFDISAPVLSADEMDAGGAIDVTCTVRNTGSREGAETVQLYLTDPVASLARPLKELKDFHKVRLQPGEEREVKFRITVDDLMFTGADGKKIAEPGEFRVRVGASSDLKGEPAVFRLK